MTTAKQKNTPATTSSAKEESYSPVKRVAPYPISVEIVKVEGQPPQKGHIVKLTEVGFLMKIQNQGFYKVGENYEVQFDVPVSDVTVKSTARVIKTYDAAVEASTAKHMEKMYTGEMHFKILSDRSKVAISTYLVKSGQKKF